MCRGALKGNVLISLLLLIFVSLIIPKSTQKNGGSQNEEKISIGIVESDLEESEGKSKASSITELVDIVKKAVAQNNNRWIDSLKKKNIELVKDNQVPTILLCYKILSDSIKKDSTMDPEKYKENIQAADVLSEIFWMATRKKFLKKAVQTFREWSPEQKKNFGEAKTIFRQGFKCYQEKKYELAAKKFIQSISLNHKIGYPEGEGAGYHYLCKSYIEQKEFDKALLANNQALEISKKLKAELSKGNCFLNFGEIYYQQSKREESCAAYKMACKLFKKIKYRFGYALSLMSLGESFRLLDDYQKSRNAFNEALLIFKEDNDILSMANCYLCLAEVEKLMDEYNSSQMNYKKALSFYKELNDPLGKANCFWGLGTIYYGQSQFDDAVKMYNKAFEIYNKIGEHDGEANCLRHICAVYVTTGKYEDAYTICKQALELYRRRKNYLGEANCLLDLGDIYSRLAELKKAKSYYRMAFNKYCDIKSLIGKANSLQGIGDILWYEGKFETALLEYESAMQIYHKIKHHTGEANCCDRLGNFYQKLGKIENAKMMYKRSLRIFRKNNTPLGEANALLNLGTVYENLGDNSIAISMLEKAMAIYKSIKIPLGVANCLSQIGRIKLETSHFHDSIIFTKKALKIYQKIRNDFGISNCYYNMGYCNQLMLEFDEAKKNYENVLRIEKEISRHFGQIWTLYRLGQIQEALKNYTTAEKYFRQSISITEDAWGGLRIGEYKSGYMATKIPFYKSLVKLLFRMEKYQDAFFYSEKSRARTFLYLLGNRHINPAKNSPTALVEEEEKLRQKIRMYPTKVFKEHDKKKYSIKNSRERQKKLEEYRQQYSAIIQKLKLFSPEYSSLKAVSILNIKEIQKILREEITAVLIEYFVTDEYTYLWLLDGTKIKSFKIAIGSKELKDRVKHYITLLADGSSIAPAIRAKGQKLYNLLLKPIEENLRGKKSIAVVPHGVLHYLPLEALINRGRFMTEHNYEFFYLPSASVLKFCLEKNSLKKERLLAIGNPDGTIPESEKEVSQIKKTFPGQTITLTGDNATETAIKNKVGFPDILHFACHGEFNYQHSLYSNILLSPDKKNDGRLEVHEIFNLRLKPAYLVTLSACETKIGEINKGDEIVSLSRAFIYAGTPSIVSSLWKVDDYYTAKFMTAFYKALKTHDKAESLNIARKTIIEKYGKRHPFYWAAFVLIGDPR